MSDLGNGAGERGSSRFFQPLKALFAGLVSALHTRLDLFVTELEEERERIKQAFIFTLLLVFGFAFGISLLTIFLVALFWQNGWILAIGGLALLYFAVAIFADVKLCGAIAGHPRLFAATLGELGKDRDYVRTSKRELSAAGNRAAQAGADRKSGARSPRGGDGLPPHSRADRSRQAFRSGKIPARLPGAERRALDVSPRRLEQENLQIRRLSLQARTAGSFAARPPLQAAPRPVALFQVGLIPVAHGRARLFVARSFGLAQIGCAAHGRALPGDRLHDSQLGLLAQRVAALLQLLSRLRR